MPGMAKTRLIQALGAQGAADLARRMLAHTVVQALAAKVGPVELCASPSQKEPIWQFLPLPTMITWSEQGEGNLGVRLMRATQRVTDAGESVLLIGTDCPALDAAHLRRSADSLRQTDATMVPTVDGGYALLGLNQCHSSLFEDIEWSTDTVAFETLHRMEQLGWKVQNNPMLHDIDRPADLRWLPQAWL
ncbi:MAG: glycosyltransferase [Castellaniella sp.]|uniref:TIGR04282 family arsenosugar biosynthesis glycosyltransferase n=1 Tax=Castellaniella sp. TaxID=1955812 RepID=UPI00120FEDCA|nr:TIGR04282 family arsenosugar biosynthesis glycosyltransferase [Castellaniella sp.]TAN30385.1 MAG: glycosyltransferase [Castellaniella sp.]